jgi:hypothetical protein
VEAEQAYSLASRDFLAQTADRVAVLQEALRGSDRNTALSLVNSLDKSELIQLFPEWVHLARCAHSPFEPVWRVILSLPRDWVLAHIEREVDAILKNEEEDDYWMFLQLYHKLDPDLARKLARRAAAHPDPEIRALGEEYLAELSQPDATRVATD